MRTYSKISSVICIVLSLLFFIACDSAYEPESPVASGPFKVTFVSNSDTAVPELSVQGGQTATKPTDPTKIDYDFDRISGNLIETKYVFIGWYNDSALTKRFDFATKITEEKTLYAKWRPIARSKITITPTGGTLTDYDNTEEVYVIDKDKTDENITSIKGATPSFIEETADSMEKGVFWTGKTVELSPFVMSRYEVTQALYTGVMTGNSFAVSGTTIKDHEGNAVNTGGPYSIDPSPSICYYEDAEADTTPYHVKTGETLAKRPVENVTWYDAVYFCNQLTAKVGGGLTAAYTISNITITLDEPPAGGTSTSGHITNATVALVEDATGYRLPTEEEWEFAARGGDTEIDPWSYVFSGSDTASGKTYDAINNSGLDET